MNSFSVFWKNLHFFLDLGQKTFFFLCIIMYIHSTHSYGERFSFFSRCGTYVAKDTLQSRTGPVQGKNRVFPVYFSHTGKTCFHYRVPRWWQQVFPCWEKYTGKPLFSLQGWVCSVGKNKGAMEKGKAFVVGRKILLLNHLV